MGAKPVQELLEQICNQLLCHSLDAERKAAQVKRWEVYLHGQNRVFIAFTDSDSSKLDLAVVSLKKRPLEESTNSADTRKGSLHPLIIGWPSQREAKKCVAAAECSWPKEILKQ